MSTPTREEIKSWLAEIGETREWLGQQLGVTKRTVDNWLSAGAPVPELKLVVLRSLMATAPGRAGRQNLVVHPTPTQWKAWQKAYKASPHETIEEWAAAGLDELAAEEQGKGLRAVADEPSAESPGRVRRVRYPKG